MCVARVVVCCMPLSHPLHTPFSGTHAAARKFPLKQNAWSSLPPQTERGEERKSYPWEYRSSLLSGRSPPADASCSARGDGPRRHVSIVLPVTQRAEALIVTMEPPDARGNRTLLP